MSDFRYFRETIVNDKTGETKTRVVSCAKPPTDVALFEAREGWRLTGAEELDGPPPLPPHVRAGVQRILDREAHRLLDEHLRNCTDEHGEYHFTPKPDVPGESTCDVCGGTFTGNPYC